MTADTLAEFKRKNRAQFQRATDRLWFIGREFYHLITVDLVRTTPGFGVQDPDDTEYIPTGRLRGGWNSTLAPIGHSVKGLAANRDEHGPFSDYGDETIERIMGQIGKRPPAVSYLENDIGYGILIVIGGGRHKNQRNWPKATQTKQASFARQAMNTRG